MQVQDTPYDEIYTMLMEAHFDDEITFIIHGIIVTGFKQHPPIRYIQHAQLNVSINNITKFPSNLWRKDGYQLFHSPCQTETGKLCVNFYISNNAGFASARDDWSNDHITRIGRVDKDVQIYVCNVPECPILKLTLEGLKPLYEDSKCLRIVSKHPMEGHPFFFGLEK